MEKKQTPAEKSKKWREKNKDKVKSYRKKYIQEHKEEIRERNRTSRNNIYFGGKCEEVFKRDNWQCQKCGMSPEQSILLFNHRLAIHHIDGNGAGTEEENNDLDNLITLCIRCHGRYHQNLRFKEKWGDLVEQDDSEWKYPKIRYLVEAEIKKGLGVQEAKRKVSESTGMNFSCIDHRYYMTKNKHKTCLA